MKPNGGEEGLVTANCITNEGDHSIHNDAGVVAGCVLCYRLAGAHKVLVAVGLATARPDSPQAAVVI